MTGTEEDRLGNDCSLATGLMVFGKGAYSKKKK
jgi:hypothetical protein